MADDGETISIEGDNTVVYLDGYPDAELAVMAACWDILTTIEHDQQARVLWWLNHRIGDDQARAEKLLHISAAAIVDAENRLDELEADAHNRDGDSPEF